MSSAAKNIIVEAWESFPKAKARPFIKWAGGKGKLLRQIVSRLPQRFNRYFEPFLGGGALFFHLQPEKAWLFDINDELINCYLAVRDRPKLLINDLKKHKHDEDYFYTLRDLDRSPRFKKLSAIRRASRLIYLNRTCFNGLYRVNAKGHFNVPFGDYVNPKIVDQENILNCSKVLKKARIKCARYSAVERITKEGDFVYFDPPYEPLSASSNFTNYSSHGFTAADQEELRNLCDRLHMMGVFFMVSNSYSPLVLNLYSRYRISVIEAHRAINADGAKRGKVNEVIITNYTTNSVDSGWR